MLDDPVSALHRAIDSIYAAALDPSRWSTALEDIMAACGLEQPGGAVLYRHDVLGGHVEFIGAGHVDARTAEVYLTRFHAINPWAERALALMPGRCVGGEQLIAPEQLLRTEFYRGFLEPFGLDTTVGAVLNAAGGLIDVITVLHRSPRGDGHAQGIEVLEILLPHLRRALQITCRIELAECTTAAFAEALDRTDRPTFIVDEHGRTVRMSPSAEWLLSRNHWLRHAPGGELRLTTLPGDARLRQAITTATRGAAASDDTSPVRQASEIAVLRPGGEPLALLILPAGHSMLGQGALALIVVVEMAEGPPPTPALLQALFGLTAAEARLASGLAAGNSLDRMAEMLGWTRETARWRLKQLHIKTGTHRLPELIRRLGQVPAIRSMAETPTVQPPPAPFDPSVQG